MKVVAKKKTHVYSTILLLVSIFPGHNLNFRREGFTSFELRTIEIP